MKILLEKEKRLKRILCISLVLYVVLIASFFALYMSFQNSIFVTLIIIAIFVGCITTSIFEFQLITIQAKTMWYEYSKNQSLVSGVGFIVIVFLMPFLFLLLVLKWVPSEWKDVINGIITSLITLLPALLSLLGIHYSLTMQEIAKRRDIQALNKPYPAIRCRQEIVSNSERITAIKADLEIENLANIILIPLYFQHNDIRFQLPYRPITIQKPIEFNSLTLDTQKPIGTTLLEFDFIYKDAIENTYKSSFSIDLNNHDDYYLDLSESQHIILN